MRTHLVAAVAAAVLSFAATNVQAAQLTGAGGTAICPVLSKWADQYAKESGDTVNYQAIGSGGGIKQIESKTVLFANPVVHLAGIKPGELVSPGLTWGRRKLRPPFSLATASLTAQHHI